ncbi:MAG TPA: hypothetical protein VG820_13840 [Fimbriimonadaceae bacterium]|nr:hypothetical protein [Fimbriimonadaceae bacterium]
MDRRKRRLIGAAAALAIGGAALIGYLARGPFAFLESFHPRHAIVLWPWSEPDGPAKDDPRREMLLFPAGQAPAVLAALKHELAEKRDFTTYTGPEQPGYWVFTPPRSNGGDDDALVFNASDEAVQDADRIIGRGVDPAIPSPPCCYVILPPRGGTWLAGLWRRVMAIFGRETGSTLVK